MGPTMVTEISIWTTPTKLRELADMAEKAWPLQLGHNNFFRTEEGHQGVRVVFRFDQEEMLKEGRRR